MTRPSQIDQIVTSLELALRTLDDPAERAQKIREAMLEGVKLALAPESDDMRRAAFQDRAMDQSMWRAMSAVRLRELGVGDKQEEK